jgi:hypothetical protein
MVDGMTIEQRWNANRTVCTLSFSKDWTWQEYEQTIRQLKEAVMMHDHEVYALWDLAHNPNVPVSALSKFRAYDARLGMPPNFKGTVIATKNGFFRSLVDVYNRSLGKHGTQTIWVVQSVEAAEQLIRTEIQRANPLNQLKSTTR